MTTTLEPKGATLPDTVDETVVALRLALGIPDTSSLDLASLSAENLATLAHSLQCQLAAAAKLYQQVCAPVNEVIAESRKLVKAAIAERGGAMLEHDTLNVRMVPPTTEWEKRIDVLLELRDHLKPDEFAKAIALTGADLKGNPKAVEAAIAAGAKPTYSAHAGQLNRLRDPKHYGENSKVGEIIARGLTLVEKGEPILEITPNESAIKAVGK